MKIIKKQQNKDIIQNDLKTTKTKHLQGANGITLIALVITIVVIATCQKIKNVPKNNSFKSTNLCFFSMYKNIKNKTK